MQMQVAVGSMPINLVLLSNETLAFVKVNQFKALFDMSPIAGGINAEFHEGLFVIDGVDYEYNTAYAYKTIPSVLSWLKQQKL